MSNWIDKYKKLVIASHKRHIIVADQDNLFDYDELKDVFESEGYIIYVAKTDLDVRVFFELQVRRSQNKYLIVAPVAYHPLPDIEIFVHFQEVGIAHLFPNLDAKAVKGLSFNALCLLSNNKLYEELSYEKTLKFLLENLYNVDFDTLTVSNAKERVLNALIIVLLEKNGINEPLRKFLSGIVKPYFPTLISKGLSGSNLLEFIQVQWLSFVSNDVSLIDFKEPLLNKSLGYLFAFEYLKPIQVTQTEYDNFPVSMKLGIFINKNGSNDTELEALLEYLKQQVQTIEDLVEQWFDIIQVFASAKLKFLNSNNDALKESYLVVERSFNIRFQRFIDNTYRSLFSLSGVRKPVVVSRILENINSRAAKRKALLVIDGMNYWQWSLIAKELTKAGIIYSAKASLAFIPTITAWSRQAIFKGEKPDLSQDNSKEGKLFVDYWQKQGFASYQIDYQKMSVNTPLDINSISNDIAILGIACNDLDDIMHGSIMGDDQLKASTQQWIEKFKIVNFISDLAKKGFQVYVTADHGNIEARGINNLKLKDKVGTLSRGKRHIHFTNEILLNSFLEENSNLDIGRKDLSLYLKHKEAFTTENDKVVTHGGSHFWEVIVPFISINER